MSRSQTAIPKVPVQFRVGAKMLEQMDRTIARTTQTRTRWISNAIKDVLTTERVYRLPITAEELLANKTTVMIRLDPLLVELVDELCEERGVPRTIWLLDACLSKMRLARKGNGTRGKTTQM